MKYSKTSEHMGAKIF